MKNFSDHEFKPSDVIEGLNAFYKKDEENKNCKCPPFSWRMGYSKYACHFFNIKTRDGKSYETFGNEHLEEAITYLREECDIFYTPGLKWEDLKYKLTSKACEKEYGTADIREMYPSCLVSPRGCGKSRAQFEAWRRELDLHPIKDLPWTTDEKEALEALRTLYYGVATRHERALKRLNDYDVNWPETSYMVEYIRKRVETADENIEYLCKENDNLRNQIQNLKDLINQIHEDSDI